MAEPFPPGELDALASDDIVIRSGLGGTGSTTGTPPRPSAPPRVTGASRLLQGLVRGARPRQWAKNVLVFTAPAAAAALLDAGVLVGALVAFVSLSLAASGTYFLNDARDVEADRRHPVKRHRPVAAGIVPVPLAKQVGVMLMVTAIAVAAAASGPTLAAVVAGYLVMTTSYTLWLKHEPVLDIAVVSLGFVLRAVAGGVATSIALSEWFLLTVSFGALFLATGKRFAEIRALGNSSATRGTLAAYSTPYLRHVTFASATITILAYSAWIFGHVLPDPWLTASVLPLVLAIFRYALLLEHGRGEAPEEVVLTDRPLQALGAVWALLFVLGVYAV